MEIVGPKGIISDAFASASKAVAAKGGIEASVLIEAMPESSEVRFTGTNYRFSVSATIDLPTKDEGAIILPANLVSTILKSLPGGDIKIKKNAEKHSDSATISAGSSKFNLRAHMEDFTEIIPKSSGKPQKINADKFLKSYKYVGGNIIENISKPILSGLLMEGVENQSSNGLRLVGTDTFRLGTDYLEGVNILGNEKQSIVPLSAMQNAFQMMAGADEISLSADDSTVTFDIRKGGLNIQLNALLISSEDNPYPDYKFILGMKDDEDGNINVDPKGKSEVCKAVIDREMLQEVLQRGTILVTSEEVRLKISLTGGAGGDPSLTAYVKNTTLGDSSESMPITSYEGEDADLYFTASYAKAAIDAHRDSEFIQMDFIDSEMAPVFISGLGEAVDKTTLLMRVVNR